MALALVLRNTCKISGAALKPAGLAPFKTYATVVASRSAPKQLLMGKNVLPLSRNITLSTPKMAAAGGNHATLWTIERLVSLGLLAVIPAAFIAPSQALDSLLAVSVVLHQHWGIEAMVMDYVRPTVFGNVLPKVAHGGVFLLSIATLGGLLYFIYNDIGIANALKKLWAIEGHKEKPQPPPEETSNKKSKK